MSQPPTTGGRALCVPTRAEAPEGPPGKGSRPDPAARSSSHGPPGPRPLSRTPGETHCYPALCPRASGLRALGTDLLLTQEQSFGRDGCFQSSGLFFLVVLRTEPRASRAPGKCSATCPAHALGFPPLSSEPEVSGDGIRGSELCAARAARPLQASQPCPAVTGSVPTCSPGWLAQAHGQPPGPCTAPQTSAPGSRSPRPEAVHHGLLALR